MVKHPKFVRPNLRKVKRVKDKWRKPHGIDSKQRQKLKWAGAVVNKGYRGSVVSRGLHPLGKAEVLVRNFGELEKNKAEWQNSLLRLQAGLSKKSKELIRKKAASLGIKVLN